MAEKKYCFSCQSERGIEHFEEGFKSCKVCREQRNTNRKHISANYAILKERLDVRQNTKNAKTSNTSTEKSKPDIPKLPEPDEVKFFDGRTHYFCKTCNSVVWYIYWERHINQLHGQKI